jgi:hypothetical protein
LKKAGEYLKAKLVKGKKLPDGRIRYSEIETASRTFGKTKGGNMVYETNPKTGTFRSWYQCKDHTGKVNRVHPKFISGLEVKSQHYPPIGSEIKIFTKTIKK